MREFFFSEKNLFETFSTEHQIVLFIFALISVFIILFARKHLNQKQQTLLGTALALSILAGMLGRMLIITLTEGFDVKEELPLYICRIVTFIMPFMMFYRHRKSFGILYFVVLAGTLNAVITPDLEFGFPHYSAWIYWLIHAGLVLVILYAVFVYRLKPTFKDLWYTFIVINIYLVLLHLLNLSIGSNYSYTIQKPPSPSLLDYMGAWPWYLLTGQLIALVLFLILYAPFFIRDKLRHRRAQ